MATTRLDPRTAALAMQGYLQCASCGEVKPSEGFGKLMSGRFKKSGICRPCRSRRQAEYKKTAKGRATERRYLEHRGRAIVHACISGDDTIRAMADLGTYDAWMMLRSVCRMIKRESSRMKASALQRRLGKIGPDAWLAVPWAKRRDAHPGERWKWRYHNEPEFHKRERERLRNQKAKRRGAFGSVSSKAWDQIKARYGRCLACGDTEAELTIDHVIPLARGGWNVPENIQPLCLTCNISKGPKSVDYRPMQDEHKGEQGRLFGGLAP